MSRTHRRTSRPRDRGSATPWIIGAVAVVVVLAAAVAIVVNGGDDDSSGDLAAVVAAATSVPADVADEVGIGVAYGVPQAITSDLLVADGKPQVLFIGAEYCPFCAAERWSLVVALSRFGTFTGLGLAKSAHEDVFPDTETFTFHGSSYTSEYLSFASYELYTSEPTGQGGYVPLDVLPPEVQASWQAVDQNLSFPFLNIGGAYIASGGGFDVSIINGRTALEIAEQLSDPTKGVSRAVVGTANTLTAAICQLTGQQPADVCSAKAVTSIDL